MQDHGFNPSMAGQRRSVSGCRIRTVKASSGATAVRPPAALPQRRITTTLPVEPLKLAFTFTPLTPSAVPSSKPANRSSGSQTPPELVSRAVEAALYNAADLKPIR